MMRIAFYAPMKSPRHEVPSGDRELSRAILSALHVNPARAEAELVSDFRCYEGKGDATRQVELLRAAKQEIERLYIEGQKRQWSVWVSYHNYYKAPDLLGPAVARALNIPYVLIEASRSEKRLQGPWADFARIAEHACDQASVIFYLTQRDRIALADQQSPGQRLVPLKPFINRSHLPRAAKTDPFAPSILSVGMMRSGDKLASYQIVAEVLERLQVQNWKLAIVGDGQARADVEALFEKFGTRVEFFGRLEPDHMQTSYQSASLLLWPGVNEAFGMSYLEAQSFGVPVVAQDRDGVREVVMPGEGLVESYTPDNLAKVVDDWLRNPAKLARNAQKCRSYVADHHLLSQAADVLWQNIKPLIKG